MKLIDEKGCLFGKMNVVDFLIVTLILTIVLVFFCVYQMLCRTPIEGPLTWIKVKAITFTIPEITEQFEAGDIAYNKNGTPDAKILKVFRNDSDFSDRTKKALLLECPLYKHRIPVLLELELLCTKKPTDNLYYYRGQPLFSRLHDSIFLTTDKYRLGYFIIKFET